MYQQKEKSEFVVLIIIQKKVNKIKKNINFTIHHSTFYKLYYFYNKIQYTAGLEMIRQQ